jgi:hypothetical protein
MLLMCPNSSVLSTLLLKLSRIILKTYASSLISSPLAKQATPLLENGSLSQLMDRRLMDYSDMKVVDHMAKAALCCLKNVKGLRLSMSEVGYIVYAWNIVDLREVPITIGCYFFVSFKHILEHRLQR